MDKKWELYVYGDVNIDIVLPNVSSLPGPGQEKEVASMKTFVGGGAALFALGAGKLGLKTVFSGAVGKDFYGEFIRKQFREQGVDDSLLICEEKEDTGISLSFTDENDRTFLTYRGTNQKISLEKINPQDVKRAGHIHITGYDGRKNHDSYLSFLRNIKDYGNTSVSLDLGWDAGEEWDEKLYELFPFLDILLMNETEAIHYAYMHKVRKKEIQNLPRAEEFVEKAAFAFAKKGPVTVIKRGSKGALAVDKNILSKAASYPVEAVDTTGAGDSFNAGFVYAFLRGYSLEDSLKIANACGALSVTAEGGNSAFPKEKELKDFIEKQEERRSL